MTQKVNALSPSDVHVDTVIGNEEEDKKTAKSDEQPRDENGQWTDGGGGGSSIYGTPDLKTTISDSAKKSMAEASKKVLDKDSKMTAAVHAYAVGIDTARPSFKTETSFRLNKALRDGKELSTEQKSMMTKLDAFIDSSSLPESISLYRGIVVNDSFQAASYEGKFLSNKGFSSTTYDGNLAKSFSDGSAMKFGGLKNGEKMIVMKINAAKGSKAAHVPSFGKKYNSEVLLPRNAKIKVKSVREENNIIFMEADYGR